ncbi:tetratricopeptide repeat protein [Candidatus Oscillochloris fontis]|uniref:tetratricopeptide repeat protein n=1 Tax=Candidatus Oscillochloris fontis TaxID=2496868 RepID=UPI00101B8304|nr:hypothetical protein [Candidatus Oscillochloris fontis]
MKLITHLCILITISALLVGCATGTDSAAALPTVTPLAIVTPTLEATATPAQPTEVAIDSIPEVQEARSKLREGNYERAVQLLRRVTATYSESRAVHEELARAYQEWGMALVESSQGDVTQVILSLDKFISGLSSLPNDSLLYQSIENSHNQARAYVDAAVAQDNFNGIAEGMEAAARQAEAQRLQGLFAELYDLDPNFPGVGQRYVQALVNTGLSYSKGGDSTPEKVRLREQAISYCQQALAIDPESSSAQECVENARESIAILTATPTPTRIPPTPQPSRLFVGLINHNERPGCISMQIRNVSAAGWRLTIDGMNLGASFDGGNNASLCGLPDHAVTFTVRDGGGNPVRGGGGIPATGGDIFVGTWK